MSETLSQKNKRKVPCTSCFKSIGVPSRMEIYTFLNDRKSATVTDVVEHLDLTQPTISYHLKEMKENGLLGSRRSGKQVHYFIDEGCPYHSKKCVLAGIDLVKETTE